MAEKEWRPFVASCDECGCDSVEVFTDSGQDNLAEDGAAAACCVCGRPGTVVVDTCEEEDDPAYIRWHDEPDCKCVWCRAMKYHDAETDRLRAQLAEAQAERDRDCAEMRRFQAEWRKMLDDVTAADARLAASESKRKLLATECRAERLWHDKCRCGGECECIPGKKLHKARVAVDAANALEEPR